MEHSGSLPNPDQQFAYGVGDLTDLFSTLRSSGLSVYHRMLLMNAAYVLLNTSLIFLVLRRNFLGAAFRFSLRHLFWH